MKRHGSRGFGDVEREAPSSEAISQLQCRLAHDGGQGSFAMDSARRSAGQLVADPTRSGGVGEEEEARGGGSSVERSAYTTLARATSAVGSMARKAAAAM